MKNETLIKAAKEKLKKLLNSCTKPQITLFNRMYSPNNLDATIDDAVDNMDVEKIDWAISQAERTVKINRL